MIHPDFHRLVCDPIHIEAMRQHARTAYPFECCGAITPEGYLPLENLDPNPFERFDCNAAVADLQMAGRLIALFHSHPNGPEGPSAHDMQAQIAMDVPWGMVSTDGQLCSFPFWWSDELDPPPLEGRLFRHGPSGTDGKGDCYALLRDYVRTTKGVLIPEFPRSDYWWTKEGASLYLDNYAKAGFRRVDEQHPEIGDVGLLQVGRTRTANHAVIYVGDGLILHHLTGQVSVRESFSQWVRMLRVWLRHE